MLTSIAEKYVKYALIADNLIGKGTVIDAYYGDPSLAKNLPQMTSDGLVNELKRLREKLNQDVMDSQSSSGVFLDRQMSSLTNRLLIHTQSLDLPYTDIIKLLLDVDLLPSSCIDINIRYNRLEQLLGQINLKNKLHEAIIAWEETGKVSSEEYISMLEKTIPEFFQKTCERVIFPTLGEEIANWVIERNKLTFELKKAKESWSAYNYYDRDFNGHIIFNKNRSLNVFDIPIFVAHEIYPGHHTNSLIREALYSHGKLGLEATAHLLSSSESPIIEGIGEYAFSLINQGDIDVNTAIAFELDRLRTEVQYLGAMQFYVYQSSPAQVKQFMRQYGLMSPERAEKSFRFIQEWKYYVPCYFIGFKLVSDAIQQYGDKIIPSLYGLCNPTILASLS
ncbi:MAG: hypothetical protein Q7R99_00420 [bacterium]|nr:hypothetical protein [bacterium]